MKNDNINETLEVVFDDISEKNDSTNETKQNEIQR